MLECVGVCWSVLHCVAVCFSVLECVCWSVLECVGVCWSELQCVAVCCCVFQCVAVCCRVLQCVAVCIHDQGLDFRKHPHPHTRITHTSMTIQQRKGHLIAICCSSGVLQCVAVRCSVL